MSDVVLTRDVSSGRVHRRVRLGKNLLTSEGCNLDQADAYEVVTEADVADSDAAVFCRRCFPEMDGGVD